MPTLTKSQLNRYLHGGGVRCLFCKSDQLEAEPLEINYEHDGPHPSQYVNCLSCGASWTDYYEVTRVSVTKIPVGKKSNDAA